MINRNQASINKIQIFVSLTAPKPLVNSIPLGETIT